jgi:hypothetical protein
MIKLEKTIVAHAKQSLLEMKSFLEDDVENDFIRALHESSALIQLGKVVDSGLSDQAINELDAVEKEQIQMLRSWRRKAE